MGMPKEQPKLQYFYKVINPVTVIDKIGISRRLERNEIFKTEEDLSKDSNFKFICSLRGCFVPEEIAELNEVLNKYPILKGAYNRTHYIEVVKEVEVVKKVIYIPIYTDIKNWLFPKKQEQIEKSDDELNSLFEEGLKYNENINS